MSIWLRRVMLGVLGLLLALIAFGTWLVMSFDANGHKGVAIEWMKTHYNRTLAIDGPIGLSVFPRLQVSLADVRLTEAGRADEFASLKSAALSVDVLPLLRGDVVVGRVTASGVRAQLLRDAQGVRNIDDLMKPTPTKPTAPANAKQPANFDIHDIALDDVSLSVRDDFAHLDGDITLKKLTTGRLRNQLETPVALDLVLDLKAPVVRGQVKGEAQITPDLDSGSVALKGMNLAFNGELPGAKSIDAKLTGSAGWDGTTTAADAQALKITLSATLAALRIDDSSLAIDRFAFNPGTKTLNVGQLQWRLKGRQGSAPVSLALDWPELTVAGSELKGSGFSGRLQRTGDAPADVSFKSGAPTGSFDALRLPGIEATFQSGDAQHKLAGTLQTNVLLRQGKDASSAASPGNGSANGKKDATTPAGASVELDAINLSALLENPGLQPFKINARGSASASAQRASWKLAGDLQGGGFDTDGSAALGGTVPKVSARARFDALDLNRLLDTPKPTPAAKNAPPAADAPVDLSGLRAIDGQFSLTAQSFSWQRYNVSPLRLDATLDNGLLKVTTLQGKIWNGAVDATASADANSQRVAMKGGASGIDLSRAVKDVADKDWIEGTGRVTMDIASTGGSVNALKSALQGQMALKLQNGAVKGINLSKAIGDARSAIGLGQNQSQKASETEKTEFSEMSVSFQVTGGVARSKDLDIRSPLLRIGGEGDIDIGKSRIDYLARATVLGGEKSANKSGDKGWAGSDLLAFKGLQVPVRLSGPFNALGWNLEWSAVKLGADLGKQLKSGAQDALEKSLGLTKDAPADKNARPAKKDPLGDALKGLMR